MFSQQLRILLNIHRQLSRLRFHSAAIPRQVNLKTICSSQQKALINLKPINLVSSVSHQSGKYSNLPSQSREFESDDENDDENLEYAEKKEGYSRRVTENMHAYTVIKNSDKVKTINPQITLDEDVPDDVVAQILAKDHEESSPAEVLEDFRLLSFHRGRKKTGILTSEKHSSILKTLQKYVSDFSDEELRKLLQIISLWYPMVVQTKEPLLIELEKALDEECILRMTVWKFDDWLKVCDLFFLLHLVRNSRFVAKCMAKMGTKAGKLSAGNYLHYMFLFNIARNPDINMYELEYRLEKFIDQFTADELAIVSMGFFKTQTPLRNPALLDKILKTTVEEIKDVHEISLSAIFKITRYSLNLNSLEKFRKLLYAFQPRINSCSVSCLVHAAHAAATVLAYEKEILNEIFVRFSANLATARIKDLERMLFSLTIFNHPKDSPQYKAIVDELRNPRRTSEKEKFPKCIATSLMYLSHANIYPLDIIEAVMDPNYLKTTYNTNAFKIGRELLTVDMGLKIEVPEYKGPFLPERVVDYLSKRYSATTIFNHHMGKPASFQRFISEFIYLLKEIVSLKEVLVEQILPHHHRADVIVCIDKDNNVVSATSYFPKLDFSEIKYAPKEPAGSRWLTFILASHNHLFRGTVEPCGTLKTKIRQLNAIGYDSIVVPHVTWHISIKSLEDRRKYLKSLLLQHDINT